MEYGANIQTDGPNSGANRNGAASASVESIISLTRQLIDVMDRENEFLESGRPKDTGKLVAEKARLGADYARESQFIKRNPDILGPKESQRRQELKGLTELFRQEVQRHRRVVQRRKLVTEGIVESIREEVSRHHNPTTHYLHEAAPMGSQARPATISFNEVV